MRALSERRQTRPGKIRSLLLVALLLAAAFLAGAATEKSAHFLQDLISTVPVAVEEIKDFVNEKAYFRIDAVNGRFRQLSETVIAYMKEKPPLFIRGP